MKLDTTRLTKELVEELMDDVHRLTREKEQAENVMSVFADIDAGKMTNASFSWANVVMMNRQHYAALVDAVADSVEEAEAELTRLRTSAAAALKVWRDLTDEANARSINEYAAWFHDAMDDLDAALTGKEDTNG